jgi:hypothetical protein
MVNDKLKDLLAISGLIFLTIMAIQFFIIHFVAFANGLQYNQYWTVVNINAFGEGAIESVIYIATIPLMWYCLYRFTKQFSVKYHKWAEPKPGTLSAKIYKIGQVTFWTTLVLTVTTIICVIILWGLNT